MNPKMTVNFEQVTNRTLQKQFILYLALFFLTWTLARLFWIKPGIETVPAGLLEAAVKTAIWVIPVFVYLSKLDRVNPLTYLRLNNKPKAVLWTINAIIITAGILYVGNHILGGAEFRVAEGFSRWLNPVILAGITEEIVFRGFILQKFMSAMKFYKANLLTALLFLLIHYPIWIAQGIATDFFIMNSLSIFILGLIWGYLFKRSGSLWPVIIYHTTYNLLIALGF